MPDLNAAQYKKLTDVLPGVALTIPQAGSDPSAPQLNDGTTAVKSVPTEERTGDVYVTLGTTSATEEWVVFKESNYLSGTLVNTAVPESQKALTADQLKKYQQDQAATGTTYLYTKYVAPYTAMPSTDVIAGLPDSNLAGVTTFVYDVKCNVGGVEAATISGQMFRERTVSSNKKVSYTDYWVFYETYFTPKGADTVTFAPNTAADRPATLKRFLSAQRARFDACSVDAQLKWRYSQIPYSFGPLPNKV